MKRVTVVVEARGGHDGVATGGHYGSWARVWASRPEIVQSRVVEESHAFSPGRLSYHSDHLVVELTIHDEIMRANDYVLIEHKRSPNPFLAGSSSRERYEVLAGQMPGWASFPQAWREWVQGPARQKAIKSLHSLEPFAEDLAEAIDYALRKTSKGRIAAAWRKVAGLLMDHDLLRHKPNFKYTWTGVYAMPIQIARAVDWRKAIRLARERRLWVEPFNPRQEGMPVYQPREEASPFLVADPSGIQLQPR